VFSDQLSIISFSVDLSLNNLNGDFGDFGDFYESSKGVALGYINLVPKGL